ncbi:MAG: hypothetical protein IT289_07440 [Oligoflexia bacterium]|nr:hypothetical protein [Oligoflexia bacterium]
MKFLILSLSAIFIFHTNAFGFQSVIKSGQTLSCETPTVHGATLNVTLMAGEIVSVRSLTISDRDFEGIESIVFHSPSINLNFAEVIPTSTGLTILESWNYDEPKRSNPDGASQGRRITLKLTKTGKVVNAVLEANFPVSGITEPIELPCRTIQN